MPKKIRLILDSNLIISFLISKNKHKLDEPLKNGKIEFVFSRSLISEVIGVASRNYFRKYFSMHELFLLIEALIKYSTVIDIKTKIALCRDPKDDFLISLAVDGKADFLLTGDKDLLVLKKVNDTKIITLSEFLEKYK